jgi:pimeloyl-ACP methyl ester carboxylesterase
MTDITPSQLPLKYRLMRRGLQALSYTVPPLATSVSFDLFSTPTRRPVRSGKTKRILKQAETQRIPFDDPMLSTFQGLEVVVHRWGDAGNRSVLLAHGWEGQAGSFREFVPKLLDAGFHVVAFDAPGHGQSTGERANLLVFMNTIRAVSDAFGPFDAIVGHSLGGIATLLTHAEQPTVPAKKLVVIAAPVHVTGSFEAFTRFWGLPNHILQGIFRRVEDAVGRSVQSFTVDAIAPDISIPVLVVHDEGDADVSFKDGETISEKLPYGELYRTSGLGHQMILRDADVVRKVVAFIQKG